MSAIPLARRQELTDATVTLNGNRAVIRGYLHEFATVTDLRTRLGCEWSWEAVDLIVSRGGRFVS